jgi:hypothetical protein
VAREMVVCTATTMTTFNGLVRYGTTIISELALVLAWRLGLSLLFSFCSGREKISGILGM